MGLWREVNVLRGSHRLMPVLGRSTGVMCKAVADWTRAKNGQFIGRLLLVLVPGYVVVRLSASRPWTWLVWAAVWFVGCCLIAACRGDFVEGPGEVEEPDPTPEDDQEMVGEQHTDTTTQPDAESKAKWLRQHVEYETAAAIQRPKDSPVHGKGVRVEDLLAGIQADGSLPGWDVKQFGALLTGIGIPVREQMYFKVDGRKSNCPGVHAEDLTTALGRAPRLPPHLVPDLTPASTTLTAVKDHPDREVA
jgi:hypothetical protein